jgi:hypothetical protein
MNATAAPACSIGKTLATNRCSAFTPAMKCRNGIWVRSTNPLPFSGFEGPIPSTTNLEDSRFFQGFQSVHQCRVLVHCFQHFLRNVDGDFHLFLIDLAVYLRLNMGSIIAQ